MRKVLEEKGACSFGAMLEKEAVWLEMDGQIGRLTDYAIDFIFKSDYQFGLS